MQNISSQTAASMFRLRSKLLVTALFSLFLSGEALAAGSARVNGQGNSISFSDYQPSTGRWMIMGARENDEWRGAALFFKRNEDGNGEWVQVKKVAEFDKKNTSFGTSVSMSGRGTLAIVGAPEAKVGSLDYAGAAYIYELKDNVWQKGIPLTSKDIVNAPQGARQGESVFMSYDGSTAFVGAPGDNGYVGAVFVYTVVKGAWKQQAKLIPQDPSGTSGFGRSISSAEKGDRVVIGGPYDESGMGATWVFERDKNGKWNQVGSKIVADGGVGGYQAQGQSVAINQLGTVMVVGAPGDNNNMGSAILFVRQKSGSWKQKVRWPSGITGSDQYPEFGASVAISARGGLVAVSAPNVLLSPGNRGRVFTYSGTPDTEYKAFATIDANPCQNLGQSVAISGLSDLLFVGAPATPPGSATVPSRGGACFYEKQTSPSSKWNLKKGSPVAWK